MRTWMEGGLVVLIGAAWAAFLAALVVGPSRTEAVLSAWRGPRAEARPEGAWARRRALRQDEVVRLPHRPGSTVRVEAGLLLVTRAGDPEDHVLGPGASLPLAGRDTVAWALVPSQLTISAAEAAPQVASGANAP